MLLPAGLYSMDPHALLADCLQKVRNRNPTRPVTFRTIKDSRALHDLLFTIGKPPSTVWSGMFYGSTYLVFGTGQISEYSDIKAMVVKYYQKNVHLATYT